MQPPPQEGIGAEEQGSNGSPGCSVDAVAAAGRGRGKGASASLEQEVKEVAPSLDPSGHKLPKHNNVPWRSNSCMKDGLSDPAVWRSLVLPRMMGFLTYKVEAWFTGQIFQPKMLLRGSNMLPEFALKTQCISP